MNYNIKKILVTLCCSLLFFVEPVFAAEIRLDSNKSEVFTKEEFLVDMNLHSGDLINAIEGRFKYPADKLILKEIRDGNSVINFWIEKPHVVTPGIVVFSGISPGGFSGANKHIFSIVFEAKLNGIAPIKNRYDEGVAK